MSWSAPINVRVSRRVAITCLALTATLATPLDAQLDAEREAILVAGARADAREGVDAFVAKRSPSFTGE